MTDRVLKAPSTEPLPLPPPPRSAKRSRPRAYHEWTTLRRWGQLPPWEPLRPGYELRVAREEAGLTQAELAEKLGVTQQAVARAERVDANPTAKLMDRWADACGGRLRISVEPYPAPDKEEEG